MQPAWARIMVAGKEISDVFLGQLSTSVFSNMSVWLHRGDSILGAGVSAPALTLSHCHCHQVGHDSAAEFLERAFERCVYSCDLRRIVRS